MLFNDRKQEMETRDQPEEKNVRECQTASRRQSRDVNETLSSVRISFDL
jgi:hypothetical protein